MSVISAVPPRALCQFLKYEDRWQQQRDRAGVIIAEGFNYWDKFQQMRPLIFFGSMGMAVLSGWLWWKRGLSKRSKVRGVEVNILYPVSTAAFSAMAWVSRPGGYLDPSRYQELPPEAIPPAPGQTGPPAPSQQTPQQVAMSNPILGWVDQKAAQYRARDPNFADEAISRFLQAPGIRGAWQELPPQAQVFLECGRG